MTLSQTAEYAVRAVLYLARVDGQQRVSAESIARALGAPVNYMSKTLNQLAKAGVVAGARGPTGGFRLAIDPSRLTVARVAGTFETARLNPICLLGDRPCNSRRPCAAHHRWTAVTQAMKAPLEETTIADLLQDADSVAGRRTAGDV
ncbi:MAG TPA: Rrf2 family transcriptional regulator [Longimicrobiales bacterium]|nr:Rrf2 family transcriptional regulator [Longimicrobiales bacterium]